ncbi:type VI secretion system accessory protein TagJ [Elioraea sp.]|uniref:type VI secretion system accessory protein TagJ n=1 Tax=Elioraea sp. TaxID=2185103 RepID=UPI003F6EBE2A
MTDPTGQTADPTAPGALFRAGRLDDAVAAANAAVRKAPSDPGPRMLLAELLLFQGNLDRADTLMDALTTMEPGLALQAAAFRQLVRAEQARRQIWSDGRVPEFLGEPSPHLKRMLAALVQLRSGDTAGAARALAEAEEARPPAAGSEGAVPFTDFRDADDLCSGFFEVLTTTGKCFWVPTERIAEVEFHVPERPRDLYWRRASMSVRDGPDGDVYIPAIYAADQASQPDPIRLGRATDWAGGDGAPMRGLGQRLFLVGEEGRSVMELTTLTFGGAS